MNFTREQIYREWVGNVSGKHTLVGSLIIIATMSVFAGLDFVAFEKALAQYFATSRLILIAGLMIFIGLNLFLARHHPQALKRFAVFNMLVPVVALNFMFLLFAVHAKAHPDIHGDLLKGTIVTVIVSYAAVGKFLRVTRIFCAASILACIFVQAVWGIDYAFRSLIQYHLVSFFVFSVINRNVKTELLDRFNAMKRFLPTRAAHEFVTTSKTIEELEDSQLKERFTAFVVSDWRAYQLLSRQLPSEQLAQLFNDFYSLVFRKLPEIVPELSYYISWTADEHRVAFYSNSKSDSEVMRMALRYVEFLTSELPKIVQSQLGVPISYDIGVSCGRSVTGLQGPEECAQYSISGEHPGIAKRLESEAAYYRRRLTEALGRAPEEPIVLFTEPFKELLAERKEPWRSVEAKSASADIFGLRVIISFGPSVPRAAFHAILNNTPILRKAL